MTIAALPPRPITASIISDEKPSPILSHDAQSLTSRLSIRSGPDCFDNEDKLTTYSWHSNSDGTHLTTPSSTTSSESGGDGRQLKRGDNSARNCTPSGNSPSITSLAVTRSGLADESRYPSPSRAVMAASSIEASNSTSNLSAASKTFSRRAQWAKDVRWLVPPERADWKGMSFKKSSKGGSSLSPSIISSSPSQPLGTQQSHSTSSPSATSVPSVSRHSESTSPITSIPPSRSASMLVYPSQQLFGRSLSESSIIAPLPPAVCRSGRRRSHYRRSTASDPRILREKMSFILEEEEGGDGSESGGSGGSGVSMASTVRSTASAPTQYQQRQPTRRSRTSSAPVNDTYGGAAMRRSYMSMSSATSRAGSVYSTPSYNTYQTAGRKVLIPSPLPGTYGLSSVYNAYSSLVLPRAAFTPSKHPDRVSSQIDITKSGLAQTSMATIEIRTGAAEALMSGLKGLNLSAMNIGNVKGRKMIGLFGTRSLIGGIGGRLLLSPSSSKGSKGLLKMPEHLRDSMPSPLGFSVHTPPPNKLPSNQVLVQVFMVGLDRLDALVVGERVERGGYGFVPGRSFVGRTVEVGFEVRNVCKGDWVYGLLDLAKVISFR